MGIDDKDWTDNIRGDVPIPPMMCSLGEESTAPVDSETSDQAYISVGRVQRDLDAFLLGGGDIIGRGMPVVDRIVFDTERGLPHIWLKMRLPIRNASEATKEVIRQELLCLTDHFCKYFERDFAVSLTLDE